MPEDATRLERSRRYRNRRIEAGLVELRVWVLAEDQDEAAKRLRSLERRAAKKLEGREGDVC